MKQMSIKGRYDGNEVRRRKECDDVTAVHNDMEIDAQKQYSEDWGCIRTCYQQVLYQ